MKIKELITACLDNNKKAWERFVRDYSKFIKNVLYRYFGVSDDVDDIMQEVFLRLLKNNFRLLKNFKGDSEFSFLSYLKKIVISTGKNYIKKNWKRNISIEEISIAEIGYNPEESILKKISVKKLMDSIYKLPIIYRDVMLLLAKGYKQKEIAEILNLNIKTVGSRILRGREKLKKYLKEF